MGEETSEQVYKEVLQEIKEIKRLLKRVVSLFEQYDADVFEDEEIKRELPSKRNNGWRR